MSRELPVQPAYVLHARPYRETSLLLEVFGRDSGRIGCIARGVRGPRGQSQRALLQPLQPLLLRCRAQGELALLTGAEAHAAALPLAGVGLLSAFYVNELLYRLLPRQDPQPELFWRYATVLGELATDAAPAWTLRRFERDLLEASGYGLLLDSDALGAPIEPGRSYRYDAEHGATPVPATTAAAVPGAALLALRDDGRPDAAALAALRRMMRRLLLHHLGGRELQSWHMLESLGALTPAVRGDEREA